MSFCYFFILLAINIFVVSIQKGPKGGYHIFVGRDASRSFATGCFNVDPDGECIRLAKTGLDGLDEKQIQEVEGWIKFYDENDDYPFVGYFPTSPAASEEAKRYL